MNDVEMTALLDNCQAAALTPAQTLAAVRHMLADAAQRRAEADDWRAAHDDWSEQDHRGRLVAVYGMTDPAF